MTGRQSVGRKTTAGHLSAGTVPTIAQALARGTSMKKDEDTRTAIGFCK